MKQLKMKAFKNKILAQVGLGFFFRLTSAAALLIATPRIIEGVGMKGYGLWSLYISILTWVLMLDFGASNQLRNASRKLIDEQQTGTELNSLILGCLAVSAGCATIITLPFGGLLDVGQRGLLLFYISILIVVITNCCKSVIYSFNSAHFVFFITATPNYVLLAFSLYPGKSYSLLAYFTAYLAGLALSLGLAVIFLKNKKISLKKTSNIISTLNKYSIFTKGIGFFLLQITSLLLVASDRVIILQLFGAVEAGKYDLTYKLSNVLLMLFSVINTVLWSQFTTQWNNKKTSETAKTFSNIDRASFLILILTIPLCISTNYIIASWISPEFTFDFTYIIGYGLYIIGFFIISSYSAFLNGVGLLRTQLKVQLSASLVKFAIVLFAFSFFSNILTPSFIVLLGGLIMCCVAYFFRRASHLASSQNN